MVMVYLYDGEILWREREREREESFSVGGKARRKHVILHAAGHACQTAQNLADIFSKRLPAVSRIASSVQQR